MASPSTDLARSTTTAGTTSTTTTSTTSTTTTTTTTLPPTTTTTTLAPTTTTTTLAPTTTTLPPLPVPIDAPADPNGFEPVVELGSIEIPKLGLTRSMFEGIRETTLDRGPGHWPGTAMPGELGNVVVAGHRVSHNRDFRDIDQLVAGDEVIFATPAGRFVYLVESIRIVEPHEMWIVTQTYDKRATLFACHPPGSTAQRIVAHLRLSGA